jgi:hypothetical protein
MPKNVSINTCHRPLFDLKKENTGAIRKKHFGEQVDISQAAIELFESSRKMKEFIEGDTEECRD